MPWEKKELNPTISISYSPPRLANVPALLGRVWGMLTNVTAGRSACESFATLAQDGSWLKTSQGCCQLMLDGSLEPYSESWPRWGMMLRGACMEPPTSARPTKGIASALWPTARRQSKTGPSKTNTRQGGGDLQTAVMWPTIKASDGRHGGPNARDSAAKQSLPSAVMWPTPTVPNGGRTLHHVEEWRGNTPYHNGQKVQVDLNHAVHWATPAAQDAKNTTLPASQLHRDTIPGNLLLEGEKGQLNPDWVACLMGYPSDWLHSDGQLGAEKRSTRGSLPAPSGE